MKNTNKKGFTIVELVVVIAVIAILAAVLIPTVSGLVKKANETKDVEVVKYLNTALAAYVNEAVKGNEADVYAAVEAAKEFGYDLPKLNAKAEGNEILWDDVNKTFCYLQDGKVNYVPEVTNPKSVQDSDFWVIDDKISTKYSTYYYGGNKIESTTSTDIAVVTDGGSLEINAPSASVYHYGYADSVLVKAVDVNSYYVRGVVTKIEIQAGRVALDKGADVAVVVVTKGATENATVKVESVNSSATVANIFVDETIANVTVSVPNVEAEKGSAEEIATKAEASAVFAGGKGTADAPYLIANAKQFLNIGKNSSVVYYKLLNNIDMSEVSTEGAYISSTAEQVVLDLDGKSINNVSANIFASIANLNMSNGIVAFNGSASVVASATSGVAVNLVFSNLELVGNITTTSSHYGSLLCYAYLRNEFDTVVSVDNVVFSASITNTNAGGYSGALVGYLHGNKAALKVTNSAMNGSVQSAFASGFAGNCTNAGAGYECSNNVVNGSVIGTSAANAFTVKYDAAATVGASAVIAKVVLATDLINVAEDGQFVVNHTNASVTKYIISLEYWVNKNSDGTGGYPRVISIEVPVSELGDGSTGLYKLNFVQVDAALDREADYECNGAKVWRDGDVYKVYDPDYTISTDYAIFRVQGYASNVLVTYQNLTYKYVDNAQ